MTDTQIRHAMSVATLPVEIAPDGPSSSVVVSNRPLRQVQIKRKIAGGILEAAVGTELCAGHMSLKK